MRTAARDEQVVDRGREVPEERLKGGGIAASNAAVLRASTSRAARPLRIAGGEDDLGALASSAPAVSSPIPALPPITTDGLPEQPRLGVDGHAGG